LAVALWWFWTVRGHVSEGRAFLERALARSDGITVAVRAKALNGACMLALNQDDYDQGVALCTESLALSQALGDKRSAATSLYRLGLVAWWRGEYAEAQTLEEGALELSREMGDKAGMADPLLILSNIAFAQGEYPKAREVEVLRLVARGLTDVQVAEQLTISHRTVHAHLSAIYSKLGISSRSAATRYALEHFLL